MIPMQQRPPVRARREDKQALIRSVGFVGMMLGALVAYVIVG